MANIHADIKPSGFNQRDEVDLLTSLVRSIYGVCVKLDADNIAGSTYTALCYTAIFTGVLEDSKGNRTGLVGDYNISPIGISDAGRLQCLYEILNALETLTEQVDADNATTSTYEALCYTAKILYLVEDSKGNTLGNGTAYRFRPGGLFNQREYVELLFQIVDAWETLLEKLDTDAVPDDTTYEALWFTATILLRIENKAGSVVGNTNPWLG